MTAPSPAAVRAYRRRVLRAHGRSMVRTALGATWDVLVGAAVLGGLGVQAGRRLVGGFPAHRELAPAATAGWLLAAAAVAVLGAAVRGLVAAGPVSAQPAALTWIFAGPVDRAGLLAPRYWLAAGGALLAGAATGAVLPLPTEPSAGLLIAATAAGALLALAAYTSVAATQPGSTRRAGVVGGGLLGVAAVAGLVVSVLGLAGRPLPAGPATAVLLVLAGAAAVVTAVAGRRARAGLGALDRGTLAAGGALVLGLSTSIAWMDTSLLAGVAAERRWRDRATVRTRRLKGTGATVLIRADLRRLGRQPGRLVGWAALAVVPYVVAAVAAPVWAAVAQVLAGAVAVGRLTVGLRAVADQPGLRRMFPLDDRRLHTLHTLLPAAGAVVWVAATAPALAAVGEPALGPAAAAAIGALAAAVRAATRPPLDYGGVVTPDTGFGSAPVGLIAQVLRGADVALLLAFLTLAGASDPVRTAIAIVALAWSLRSPAAD
ncbi:MAG TPA: DUF6297 family protein [Mycobacteriales bacterium]|nr:DUF6297 family protein [Mycobacteriales bacterium]